MIKHQDFINQQLKILFLTGIALLLVFELTSTDIWINNFFYNSQLKVFSLRDHPFMTQVMHHGFKIAMYVFGITSILLGIWFLKKRKTLLLKKHVALGSVGLIFIPAIVTFLKHLTNKHCPWSLDIYGGHLPYRGLFDANVSYLEVGECFPAGHAAGGFMWLSWAMALWFIYPKLAKIILILSIALGLILGISRMMQGAHFLSHVLWTAWFAWFISFILAILFRIIPNAKIHH
jgi:membrane-associated PAP2 superfamily phosphatase